MSCEIRMTSSLGIQLTRYCRHCNAKRLLLMPPCGANGAPDQQKNCCSWPSRPAWRPCWLRCNKLCHALSFIISYDVILRSRSIDNLSLLSKADAVSGSEVPGEDRASMLCTVCGSSFSLLLGKIHVLESSYSAPASAYVRTSPFFSHLCFAKSFFFCFPVLIPLSVIYACKASPYLIRQ